MGEHTAAKEEGAEMIEVNVITTNATHITLIRFTG
jgi:hypothetical protein